jgi:hypothetical protein
MNPIENIDDLRIGSKVTFIKQHTEYTLLDITQRLASQITKTGIIVKKEGPIITIQTEPKVMYKVSFNNATFYVGAEDL